jgi:phenylpropionate dioxygenase-like ring-hydroxylating dioxygenase large terminal subunit
MNNNEIIKLIESQKPGHSLAQRFYTDPDIYALELERIVMRTWILVGHESELPRPGDFKVFTAAGESAIIVRGSDGDVRAFANVCRHRGSLVCLKKRGHTRKFMCTYHGWMYDVDGNLTAARNMDESFDMGAHGLRPLKLETLNGLMLICFGDDAASLDAARRDLAGPMAMFDFPNLKVAAHKEYPIAANWKLAVENYVECYHCATAHPDYAKMHTLMLDKEKREKVQAHMLTRMRACGLKEYFYEYVDAYSRPGQMGYAYSRTALFEGYLTGSKGGQPVAPLLGKFTDYDGGASDFSLGPFSYMLAYSDHVVAYVFTPVDAENSRCDIYWLVRNDAEDGNDYDVDELTWLWNVTTQADKDIIVNTWKGVKSRNYVPGPFSGMERYEQNFIEWVLRELARPTAA